MEIPRIKLFVSDIDGTITNGLMTFDEKGGCSKSYHTRDCTVLWRLQFEGKIDVLMLTGSNYPCDTHRFRFLEDGDFHNEYKEGMYPPPKPKHLAQNVHYHDKEKFLAEYLAKNGIKWSEVAYIGDAMNDYGPMRQAGWTACPYDAEDEIKKVSDHICQAVGGNGAVYEFGNMVLDHLMRTMPNG